MALPDDFDALAAQAEQCAEKARAASAVQPAAGPPSVPPPPQSEPPEQSVASGSAQPARAEKSVTIQVEPTEKHIEDDGRTWGYLASGVGLVGVGVGAVTGVMAVDSKNKLDDPELCNANSCSSEGNDVQKQGKMYATMSTVGFSAGVVGLGVGAYLLFFRSNDDAPKATATTVDVAPLKGGFQVTLGTSL